MPGLGRHREGLGAFSPGPRSWRRGPRSYTKPDRREFAQEIVFVRIYWLAVVQLLVLVVGCAGVSRNDDVVERVDAEVVAQLSRDLPGSIAALYHLRIPSTGGLRLTLLGLDRRGQMSISEPFGALVSVSTWSDFDSVTVYDMKAGCRVDGASLDRVFGVVSLPMSQALRLLGGRLPSIKGDHIVIDEGNSVTIAGDRWKARVWLESRPWRVVRVDDATDPDGPRWMVELSGHTSTLPGKIRFEHDQTGWAELELVSLQWDQLETLPAPPQLSPCKQK